MFLGVAAGGCVGEGLEIQHFVGPFETLKDFTAFQCVDIFDKSISINSNYITAVKKVPKYIHSVLYLSTFWRHLHFTGVFPFEIVLLIHKHLEENIVLFTL